MEVINRSDLRKTILDGIKVANIEYRNRMKRVKDLEDSYDRELMRNQEQAEACVQTIDMHRKRMSKLLTAMVHLARACNTVCIGNSGKSDIF